MGVIVKWLECKGNFSSAKYLTKKSNPRIIPEKGIDRIKGDE